MLLRGTNDYVDIIAIVHSNQVSNRRFTIYGRVISKLFVVARTTIVADTIFVDAHILTQLQAQKALFLFWGSSSTTGRSNKTRTLNLPSEAYQLH